MAINYTVPKPVGLGDNRESYMEDEDYDFLKRIKGNDNLSEYEKKKEK